MKIMKRFGLILSLSLLLVIGGVYAAWTYTQVSEDEPIEDKTGTVDPSITDIDIKTIAIGEIEVAESNLSVVVDEDSENKHKAKLNATGSYTITWTGNEDDDETTTKVEEVYLEVNVAYTNSDNLVKYDNKEVFVLTSLIGNTKLGKSSTFTVNLSDLISLNGDIYANTVQNYNNLKNAIESSDITITFSVVTK